MIRANLGVDKWDHIASHRIADVVALPVTLATTNDTVIDHAIYAAAQGCTLLIAGNWQLANLVRDRAALASRTLVEAGFRHSVEFMEFVEDGSALARLDVIR